MKEARCIKECPIIETWRNSSLVVWIATSFDAKGVFLKIGLADGSGFIEPVKARFHPTKMVYRAYVPAKYFPHGGETEYKIEAIDESGERRVVGTNKLRIFEGGIDDPDDSSRADVSKNCHIRLGDEWYRMTVTDDGDGGLTFDIAQSAELDGEFTGGTGVSVDSLYDFKTPYAYNIATGLFHRVSAYRDVYGKVMAEVDDAGVEGEEKSFALDPRTGLYYEVNSDGDGTGETLVVGGVK